MFTKHLILSFIYNPICFVDYDCINYHVGFFNKRKKPAARAGLYWYVGFAAFLSIICIVLGTSAEVKSAADDATKYFYVFYQNAALIGGKQFNYLVFAGFMAFSVVALMLFDIIVGINSMNSRECSLPSYIDSKVARCG